MSNDLSIKTKLRNIKKGSLRVNEYTLQIKIVVYRLASVGHIISSSNHVEAIFNGLLEKYDTFVISVNSRSECNFVEQIESLLLAQEARIENHSKELDSSYALVNPYRKSIAEKAQTLILILSLVMAKVTFKETEGIIPQCSWFWSFLNRDGRSN